MIFHKVATKEKGSIQTEPTSLTDGAQPVSTETAKDKTIESDKQTEVSLSAPVTKEEEVVDTTPPAEQVSLGGLRAADSVSRFVVLSTTLPVFHGFLKFFS